MSRKVYIIHGWGSDSNLPWIKWLEGELLHKGIEVHALDMPNTYEPKIEEWVAYLKNAVGKIDEDTYFVGHSVGCQTIMRFLEKEPKHLKIAGCIFVAPWLDLIGLENEELEIAHPWINNKIDFERVLDHTGNFACIFSGNDKFVSEEERKKFKKYLGAKIIMKGEMGHFEKTEKIEEILHEIK